MTRIGFTFVTAVLIGSGLGCGEHADVGTSPIGTAVEVTRQDGGVVGGTPTASGDLRLQMMDVGPASRFREFTVPDGTVLALRLDSPIASDTSHAEDPVEATLTDAVLVDGVVVLPKDSVLTGVVTTADPSGDSGRASLAVRFRSVSIDGRDETYLLSAGLHHMAASTGSADARTTVGTTVVLTTAGDDIRLPSGTALLVALDEALDVRVPIVR